MRAAGIGPGDTMTKAHAHAQFIMSGTTHRTRTTLLKWQVVVHVNVR